MHVASHNRLLSLIVDVDESESALAPSRTGGNSSRPLNSASTSWVPVDV